MTITAEELALVDAIHADPRNDGPRLAYAAWLADNGAGDYAEFIRLQCERPYVCISTRDEPHVSHSYEFPWHDQAAKKRLKRVLALYPGLLASERFAPFRQGYYHQESRRGLTQWEVDGVDLTPDSAGENVLVTAPPPLLRFRLSLHTTPEDLVMWLNHPSMRRVDVLLLAVESDTYRSSSHPFVELSRVDFSFFRGLEEINLGQVDDDLAVQLERQAELAGISISHDDWNG